MSFSNLRSRCSATLILLSVSFLTACGGGGNALPAGAVAQSSPSPRPMQIISQNGSSITLTGSIVAMISGGFQVQGGQGVGFLHIYVNSSTSITGPAPYVGENVEVVGTGSLSSGNITAASVTQIVASPSPSPTASAPPQPTSSPVGSGTPIPPQNGVLAQTGQVLSAAPGKLVIQAGPGCGSMYVYVNSSTTYFDGAPAAGQYGSFTGTGTRCDAITANTVSLSSSAFTSTTMNGTVSQGQPYGFTLNTGTAAVPVAMSASTVVFGSALVVGSKVTVTALGTTSTGLTATQIAVASPPTPTPNPSVSPSPTPGPIETVHIPIAGYVYAYGGVPTNIPLATVAQYLNWAQTDEAHAAELRSAGIKVAVYSNFWRNYASDNPIVGYTDLEPGGAHAAAEALDCNNNPVYDPNYGGGYEADPRTSSALAHAQIVANYRLNQYSGNDDALFSDDAGAVWGITLPCNYGEAAYDQAVNAVHSALGTPVWVNALGAPPDPANAVDLVEPANVLGGMCEECYASNASGSDTIQTGQSWINVEDAEIGVVAQHKVFWDYARATGDPAQETALRLYVYASLLLAYDPAYTMFQEAFATASGLPVMPETGLIATNPLSTASDVSGYQAPGGSYMRQFADCYYRGAFVNNCAVVVNPGSSSVPIPSTSYSHALSVTGSDVLDGGSLNFTSAAPSQLAPYSAAILFP